jgi:type IV pilus assembly PilO-like protein
METAAIRHIYSSYKKIVIAIVVLFVMNIAMQYYISVIQSEQLSILYADAQKRLTKDHIEKVRADAAKAEKALSDLDNWRNSIYAKRDFARYVGELLDIVTGNNLAVSSITYKPAVVDNNKLLSYQIRMAISGKYRPIKNLLGDLQRLKNATIVNDVTLDNSSLTEENVQLNLALTTYFRTEEQ